jgi:hypothetical protein
VLCLLPLPSPRPQPRPTSHRSASVFAWFTSTTAVFLFYNVRNQLQALIMHLPYLVPVWLLIASLLLVQARCTACSALTSR